MKVFQNVKLVTEVINPPDFIFIQAYTLKQAEHVHEEEIPKYYLVFTVQASDLHSE